MTKEEFLEKLENNGVLIAKRCTENYLRKNNLLHYLDEWVSTDFGSIGERIKHLKYGGGYCLVCNTRTNILNTGLGFAKYCKDHFHEPKLGKKAHNFKNADIAFAIELYKQGNSLLSISKKMGNISNTTLKKRLKESGIEFRSHSENQKLNSANKGKTLPRIIINREDLRVKYTQDKMPIPAIADLYKCSQETIRRFLIQEGIERTNRRSNLEWKLINLIKDLNVDYRCNVKNLIYPYEIDILIPNYNLAIEINGLYTHSFYSGQKPINYHYTKYKMCLEKGITLLQFWEDDIYEKFDIISSMIKSRLNMSMAALDARKCKCRKITLDDVKNFCNQNHIQGAPGYNSIALGLFYNDELVSVLSYYHNKSDIIINRFCSKLNYQVRGAFGKLLKQLPQNQKIITYSSNDISNGNVYSKLGFKCTRESKSDLWFTDYKKILNRQKYMKSKLPKILNNYDESKTEIENMISNGYDVIYKSGTKTWILDPSDLSYF